MVHLHINIFFGENMSTAHSQFRHVNGMLNIGYLTGLVVRVEKDCFYIRQTANEQLDIPIYLPNSEFRAPEKLKMKTVVVHIHSEQGEYGLTAKAVAVDVSDPSILTMPPMNSFLLGFAKKIPIEKMDEIKIPFNRDGTLKKDYLNALLEAEHESDSIKMLISMYEQSRGKNQRVDMESNSNRVMVAGFVHKRSFVTPNEHQSHGHGRIDLRQHENEDKALPIRLVGKNTLAQLKQLRSRGAAIKVAGRLRRKITPTADGTGILSDVLYIETDLLQRAEPQKDIISVPRWLSDYQDAAAEAQKPTETPQEVTAEIAETQAS